MMCQRLKKDYENDMHYAIGDLHGQLSALKELLVTIQYDPEEDFLYFVGDYTDWGPDSMELIKLLMQLEAENPGVHPLLGNHDLMMWKTITNPEITDQTLQGVSHWARNRGDVTLRQYLALPREEQEQILKWIEQLPVEAFVEVDGVSAAASSDYVQDAAGAEQNALKYRYCICHGMPLSAVAEKPEGWNQPQRARAYLQTGDNYGRTVAFPELTIGIMNAALDPEIRTILWQLIYDAVWYRIRPYETWHCQIPILKDVQIIRGHSITPSRRLESWENGIINIDCGAKVLQASLADEDGDVEEWKLDQTAKLAAFCLETQEVFYAGRHAEISDLEKP